MVANQHLPNDVKPQWLSVIRRLQSVARKNNHGLAVIGIKVVVDPNGKPIQWTEPTVTRLEPKASKDDFVSLLTEDRPMP